MHNCKESTINIDSIKSKSSHKLCWSECAICGVDPLHVQQDTQSIYKPTKLQIHKDGSQRHILCHKCFGSVFIDAVSQLRITGIKCYQCTTIINNGHPSDSLINMLMRLLIIERKSHVDGAVGLLNRLLFEAIYRGKAQIVEQLVGQCGAGVTDSNVYHQQYENQVHMLTPILYADFHSQATTHHYLIVRTNESIENKNKDADFDNQTKICDNLVKANKSIENINIDGELSTNETPTKIPN